MDPFHDNTNLNRKHSGHGLVWACGCCHTEYQTFTKFMMHIQEKCIGSGGQMKAGSK